MKPINEMRLRIESRSVNEAFARAAVAAFVSQLDPTLEEISDIKTAVSEAVTNCIVHAYADSVGQIYIWAGLYEDGGVRIKIRDTGCGIEDVKKAMEPLYTTRRGAGGSRLRRHGELLRQAGRALRTGQGHHGNSDKVYQGA